MTPDAPTSEPAMISTLLSITNPVAAAAKPEYEFSRAMTTGMSAPPIGPTSRIPSTEATKTTTQKATGDPLATIHHIRNKMRAARPALMTCPNGKTSGFQNARSSCNLPKAIRLPLNVTDPMIPTARWQ